jgi:uncharacterized membrane protein
VSKTRIEAFSDGVIAIILTIMVLDLKVPKEYSVSALASLWPVYVAYVLSYALVFLAWLNHHSIFSAVAEVDRPVLLANGLLLFSISFIPFATAFAGEAHWGSPVPVVTYGLVMVLVSLAFSYLRHVVSRCAIDTAVASKQRAESKKGLFFAAAFFAGACVGIFYPRLALVLYGLHPLYAAVRRASVRVEFSA